MKIITEALITISMTEILFRITYVEFDKFYVHEFNDIHKAREIMHYAEVAHFGYLKGHELCLEVFV